MQCCKNCGQSLKIDHKIFEGLGIAPRRTAPFCLECSEAASEGQEKDRLRRVRRRVEDHLRKHPNSIEGIAQQLGLSLE